MEDSLPGSTIKAPMYPFDSGNLANTFNTYEEYISARFDLSLLVLKTSLRELKSVEMTTNVRHWYYKDIQSKQYTNEREREPEIHLCFEILSYQTAFL